MSSHHFDPTILRAYDIRGIYQDTLSEADAHAIGMAFIPCLRNRGHGVTVAVGRDGAVGTHPRARCYGQCHHQSHPRPLNLNAAAGSEYHPLR